MLLVAQASALAGAVLVATLISADVTGRDLAFGAIAGSANVLGLGLLYHGLAHGQMSTVAPVTAVVGAIVPVSWGLIEGERPSALVLVGVGCALVAGALLAREEDGGPKVGGRSQLLVAGAAGAALGTSFIMFAKTSSAVRLLARPLGPAGCGRARRPRRAAGAGPNRLGDLPGGAGPRPGARGRAGSTCSPRRCW